MELYKETIFLLHSVDSDFILCEMGINFLLLMDLQILCVKFVSDKTLKRETFFPLHCLGRNSKAASHFWGGCLNTPAPQT